MVIFPFGYQFRCKLSSSTSVISTLTPITCSIFFYFFYFYFRCYSLVESLLLFISSISSSATAPTLPASSLYHRNRFVFLLHSTVSCVPHFIGRVFVRSRRGRHTSRGNQHNYSAHYQMGPGEEPECLGKFKKTISKLFWARKESQNEDKEKFI